MDRQRRRFIPKSENLEVRKLLATSSNVFSTSSSSNTQDLAANIQQKEQRIEHLPSYMKGLQANRFLPKDLTTEIQSGLTSLMTHLHKPSTEVLDSFNLTLRKIVPNVSLSAGDARKLHQSFVQVMQSAKAPQNAIDQLSASLNQLATQVDTASVQPVFLATNDYTLVLQTALSVGKPLPAPQIPMIAKNSGVELNRTHFKSTVINPNFSGTYVRGTTVQIVNLEGQVVGEGAANNMGQYRVRISTPLQPGSTYTFFTRAEDQGYLGLNSRTFEVKVGANAKAK